MSDKTEIFQVKFNKYKTNTGDVAYSIYTIGTSYEVGKVQICPIGIKIVKDRVIVSFNDGGKHEFGVNPDTEIFRRVAPVKKETKNKQ